ncbi:MULTISPECIES: helix-turn-helix transcriptional regulator [unclassified Streptomyces]|uniref:helix-turn-helix domain-containing protein n=1 Tax=unclassified Streptomyces TaxID=2593676 RepID=UPI00081E209D|nr:helix-turn-helix transcriptional regulator [Streptomyces sp. LcepLS]MYR29185.1 helix-turn-helix domain-containing protein [Streptomyces sp. SID4945]SCF44572.1 Helix-turn-helix [Streptomyces sp. LcepLS]
MPPEPDALDAFRRQLADRIRDHRLWRNLSQEQVAERTGLSAHTVQRIESGTRETKVSYLFRLAHALDCEVRDLLP